MTRGPDTRSSELQISLLVESVTDYAIFLLDVDGNIATWNRGAERLKGYRADEIIGRHFSVFYTSEDRERHHPDHELQVAIRDGRFEEEGWRIRRDGSRFWANVVITALRDSSGKHVGFGKVTRDLTARRAAEQALHVANEELDRFASLAAHDMSDPLRTIAGFAELLAKEEHGPLAAEWVSHIVTTSDRMRRLLDSLLAFARAGEEAYPSERVELATATAHVLASLAGAVRESGAEIVTRLPEAAVVRATGHDVELVLQNLVSNALKFGDSARPRVEITAEPAGDSWRLVVADNGLGIAPGDHERIFGAFERAHAEDGHHGSGLGLAICERLVQRHGGTLGVESTPGQGSRFWVLLPASTATA